MRTVDVFALSRLLIKCNVAANMPSIPKNRSAGSRERPIYGCIISSRTVDPVMHNVVIAIIKLGEIGWPDSLNDVIKGVENIIYKVSSWKHQKAGKCNMSNTIRVVSALPSQEKGITASTPKPVTARKRMIM